MLFVDANRESYGVEPICRMLPIAPSTYYEQKAREKDPSRQPARAKRDVQLRGEIRRVRQENFDVYGVRKVWRQLCREAATWLDARWVARLMREMGLQEAVRGTSIQDDEAGFERRSPDGPRGARLQRHTPERALGLGPDLRCHVARLRVCRLRHRRLRSTHRRLASDDIG